MANPNQPDTYGRRGRLIPFLVVGGLAVVAFVVALIAFRGGGSTSAPDVASGGSACGDGKPDSAYSVTVDSDPNPPRAEGTTFHLSVKHDGNAVAGAKVCMTADMTGMHHEGINNTAKEGSGGKYDATLKFGMRGPYVGSVIIAQPGKSAVSVPVTFQVD